MKALREWGFAYAAASPYNTLTLDVAGEADAPRLAQMCRDVRINAGDYKAKLDPENPASFRQRGGFFQILDEAEIRGIIASDDACFVTLRREGGIIASCWVSLRDPSFAGYEPRDRGLEEAMETGKTLFLREMIVADARAGRRVPHTLHYGIMDAMRRRGFTHSLGEIYRLDSYFDGETHRTDMLNEPSFYVVMSLGAWVDGELPQKTVRADGFTADVTPLVMAMEYRTALPALEKLLAEREIRVCRGGLF